MIRVAPIPPTASYEDEVRIPGGAYLATNPHPSREEFNRHDFWREIHDEMYTAYGGICMYCASWTPRTPGGASLQQSSIDHFLPKSLVPALAYDWSNFRLCRNDINANKAIELYIPDPFSIRNQWFEVDFTTWRVGPSATAPPYISHRIRFASSKLGLNDDYYVEERQSAAAIYVHRPAERAELRQLYPFLTAELERQAPGTTLLADLRTVLQRHNTEAAVSNIPRANHRRSELTMDIDLDNSGHSCENPRHNRQNLV